MGIDKISLSSELIKSLYPESLVDGTNPFWGKNLRNISFICHCPEQDFLPDVQFIFLHKMLSACKLSPDDIVLLNIAHSSFSFSELRKQWQPAIIFLWGVSPELLGLKTLPDFSISIIDNISIIQVSSPDALTGNDTRGHALKQQLWACLKKLFNL